MADVFISYHEASAGELAEQIADALEEAGISCWCARRDIPFGGHFAREISSQIHACKVFLVLLNQEVYQSPYIENELGVAFKRLKENILILPIELGEFVRKGVFEYYLVHSQSFKFSAQPNEQQIQRLVKQISQRLQQTPQLSTKKLETPSILPTKIINRGQCGDTLTYTLDENGTLTISGTGSMWRFHQDVETKDYDTPWWNERKTISCAVIQKGVTAIGVGAFSGCTGLTRVIIPDSINTIGWEAFSYCQNLKSVYIPYSMIYIDVGTFDGCASLTGINIPISVTKIGWNAFRACVRLKKVIIPESVISIGDSAFYGCTELTSVRIPNSLKSIGNLAFSNCSKLTNVNIPDSVNFIGYGAFSNCSKMESVSVPANAKIAGNAFPLNCLGDAQRVKQREEYPKYD